jgi:hypothetical protein
MESRKTSRAWAVETFGKVDLGDARRSARLVDMATAACERPSGRVSAVFPEHREREGAYDFLENEHVDNEAMKAGVLAATARRCMGLPFVFVPVDGTSVTVTDRTGERDFGRIGADTHGARGLKVIDALAVDPQGVPVGVLGLTSWARGERSPEKGTYARQARPLEERETRFWVETVKSAAAALDEEGVRGWFQIDREGDGRDLLLALQATSHWWTVRGNADRSIELEGGDVAKLRSTLMGQTLSGTYPLEIPARPGRPKRTATMAVRTARVLLRLRDQKNDRITRLSVTVVWALEEGSTIAGSKPTDWLLYTSHPVETFDDARLVIYGYEQRWRIEEFHKTWKRGDCDVESTQLGSFASVQRWALVLAAVAVRLERLKRLSRTQPDLPASVEFTPTEIRALKMLHFDGRPMPTRAPTLSEAVAWLAELGGFANAYSGRLPGATVLGRGLKYLRPAANLLEIQLRATK